VDRAIAGDGMAVEKLCDRLRPRLTAWAKGRLPAYARGLGDTEDLVQEALVGSIRRLPVFDNTERNGFLQYLKRAVMNRIRNEIRSARRRGVRASLDEAIADRAPLPIEQYLRREDERRYRRALAKLSPGDRELVIARVELQMTAQEIAMHTGRSTAAAARMATRRAILKLATLLHEP
jgi:RNA polymerase sigma factor (sigma-70 family)